jgi:hypothetical protein
MATKTRIPSHAGIASVWGLNNASQEYDASPFGPRKRHQRHFIAFVQSWGYEGAFAVSVR